MLNKTLVLAAEFCTKPVAEGSELCEKYAERRTMRYGLLLHGFSGLCQAGWPPLLRWHAAAGKYSTDSHAR